MNNVKARLNRYTHTIAIPLLLLSCANTAARETDYELERLLSLDLDELAEITVATGTTRTRETLPAVATIITAEQIRRMGAIDLYEVLERVPGFHISTGNQVFEKK